MRNTSRLSVQNLLLTAAFAFALSAPAAAREHPPTAKPLQIEKPEPAGKPAPEKPGAQQGKEPVEEEAPPGGESEEQQAPEAAPPETEVAPEEQPSEEAKPEEEALSPQEEAVNAAVEMSKRLAGLKTFSVKANLAWEEVMENGEKILALEQVRADVARPHGLRMERTSPERERVLFYNGEVVALWGPVTRYYAAVPFTGTLPELANHLADKYSYEIPLADLFLWGHDKEQIEAIKSANFIGQDVIGRRVCDHYAFRQEGADWQLWIDTGEGGLPCGYAIIDLSDPARPLFMATIEVNPDAAFDDNRFTFEPPEDAVEIPLATTRPLEEGTAPKEGETPQEGKVPTQQEAVPEEPGAPGKGEPETPDTDEQGEPPK